MIDQTPERPVRRLVSATATEVLDEYNHRIDFKEPGDLAIIFGPNGIGKTKFLEIIDALSNLHTDRLGSLPFASASLTYSDGTVFSVRRDREEMTDENMRIYQDILPPGMSAEYLRRAMGPATRADVGAEVVDVLHFALLSDGEKVTARTIIMDSDERWHPSSMLARYEMEALSGAGMSPREIRQILRTRGLRNAQAFKTEFLEFTDSLDVRLIETQRLVTYENDDRTTVGNAKSREAKASRPTIEQHSQTVRAQLESDLSANSRLTQRLDSTFPRRMLEVGDRATMTEEQIREQLADQNRRRARITEITPLGLGDDIPLPPGELTRSQIAMLELYLQDAELKLESFASTVTKINLLENIVNTRLLRKKLQISAEKGLKITRENSDASIPLTALSSGEQHEIILMFDLLFNVRPGGLVLIDEPEISLHIAWQQKFISDVIEIARLVGFQFVIATHSPQIIDNFWPNAERLGPISSETTEHDPDGPDA